MEIAKLIYKISDQLEIKDTQELLLDIEITNEEKYETKTRELALEINSEIEELQVKLDDKENMESILSIFETITESLEAIYKNTELSLDKLIENAKGTEIVEQLIEISNSK